jgi:nucleoid-associated protein YgaU
MANPKRQTSPYRGREIVDDGVDVIQGRRFPIKPTVRNDDVKYTVLFGDHIFKMATKFLGSPFLYWLIMDRNEIDYPLDLQPGQKIIIPSVTSANLELRKL